MGGTLQGTHQGGCWLSASAGLVGVLDRAACATLAGLLLRHVQDFILRTARDIAHGLDHLHSALSLVHRDL